MTTAKCLWVLGSFIIAFLGAIHLYYTFFTNKFSPRNQTLEHEMKETHPVLTGRTTMWDAWIGFNGSHSSGAIFIGLMNMYLAATYFPLLQTDHSFFVFNIFTIAFYVWLAKRYWFKIPLTGIAATLICFVVSYILILADRG